MRVTTLAEKSRCTRSRPSNSCSSNSESLGVPGNAAQNNLTTSVRSIVLDYDWALTAQIWLIVDIKVSAIGEADSPGES